MRRACPVTKEPSTVSHRSSTCCRSPSRQTRAAHLGRPKPAEAHHLCHLVLLAVLERIIVVVLDPLAIDTLDLAIRGGLVLVRCR